MWVWVVLIVVLIGAVAVVASGRGGALAEVYDDRPDSTMPAGRPLTADDLREMRFSTAVRGYRMDEVDALLARLQVDLLARERREPPSDAEPGESSGPVSSPTEASSTDALAGAEPPSDDSPTDEPPTGAPSTDEPPTDEPPTEESPTEESPTAARPSAGEPMTGEPPTSERAP